MRDTFTVTRQPDGRWIAKMHGFKAAEYYGDTASEALSRAGRATDYAAVALDEMNAKKDAPTSA